MPGGIPKSKPKAGGPTLKILEQNVTKLTSKVHRKMKLLLVITVTWSLFLLFAFIAELHSHHFPTFSGRKVPRESITNLQEEYTSRDMLRMIPDYSNLPVNFWLRNFVRKVGDGQCSKIPHLVEVHFNNLHWQKVYTRNGSLFLYSAYYDCRKQFKYPIIRVISMADSRHPLPIFCQIWFESHAQAEVTSATYSYAWLDEWGSFPDGTLQPFIISCEVPWRRQGDTELPVALTLAPQKCWQQNTNLMKIVYDKQPEEKTRQPIAVCVKGLSFPSSSSALRLVEWLEMLRLLGAQKVFVYELMVHPYTSKVLKYYQEMNFVDVRPMTLPGTQPNSAFLQQFYLKQMVNEKRLNEVLPYNDCLYRNMYRYKYLAVMDIDEMIVPQNHNSWTQLLDALENGVLRQRVDSFAFRHVYFSSVYSDGAVTQRYPKYMHMLSHIFRSTKYSNRQENAKCFHLVDRIVTLHNHFPLQCSSICNLYSVPVDQAVLHHYRKPPRKLLDDRRSLRGTVDKRLWKYGRKLEQRVEKVIGDLRLLDKMAL